MKSFRFQDIGLEDTVHRSKRVPTSPIYKQRIESAMPGRGTRLDLRWGIVLALPGKQSLKMENGNEIYKRKRQMLALYGSRRRKKEKQREQVGHKGEKPIWAIRLVFGRREQDAEYAERNTLITEDFAHRVRHS